MADKLRIADLIYRTRAEGAGERTALWLQGCSLRCAGCCNRDMFSLNLGHEITVDSLVEEIRQQGTCRLTVLGGEPLDQPEALTRFLRRYRESFGNMSDIWLFSGYTYQEIKGDRLKNECAGLCDILVSGRFVPALSPDSRVWIGSSNQEIRSFTPRGTAYIEEWPRNKFDIDIHISDNEVRINGWPLDT